MREAEAVARAKVESTWMRTYVETNMALLQDVEEGSISSMHVDLERGNRLEVSILNGTIDRLGRGLGIPTPVNSFITACLMLTHNRAKARHASSVHRG